MKKLYILMTNNGDWGGLRQEYVIASSEEEAAAQNKNYQKRIALGHDHYITELDGNSLLKVLSIEDSDKYNCKLIITEKEGMSEMNSCEGCVNESEKSHLLICCTCRRHYHYADLYKPERRTDER